MYVDFLLPEIKLILELQGPSHFVKPEFKQLNLVTTFKDKCLETLGYKVIAVPYNTIPLHGISFDTYMLEQLRDYQKPKQN